MEDVHMDRRKMLSLAAFGLLGATPSLALAQGRGLERREQEGRGERARERHRREERERREEEERRNPR